MCSPLWSGAGLHSVCVQITSLLKTSSGFMSPEEHSDLKVCRTPNNPRLTDGMKPLLLYVKAVIGWSLEAAVRGQRPTQRARKTGNVYHLMSRRYLPSDPHFLWHFFRFEGQQVLKYCSSLIPAVVKSVNLLKVTFIFAHCSYLFQRTYVASLMFLPTNYIGVVIWVFTF